MREMLEVTGILLILIGVALVSLPLALVLAGVVLVLAAYRARPSVDLQDARSPGATELRRRAS